ncbi:hypothetical protein [Paraburkholderia youngii]|uniref:hypothetical protein n=1 Tax=Paraburkholderia youngii TaxID=2782701 RepID=UPI003D20F38C
MTEKSISLKQLEARIDVLSFAFQALTDRLTYAESSQVKSKLANLVESACNYVEPENITDPYRLELRAFCAQLLQPQ